MPRRFEVIVRFQIRQSVSGLSHTLFDESYKFHTVSVSLYALRKVELLKLRTIIKRIKLGETDPAEYVSVFICKYVILPALYVIEGIKVVKNRIKIYGSRYVKAVQFQIVSCKLRNFGVVIRSDRSN